VDKVKTGLVVTQIIHPWGNDHASNAMDNFCFEVTLGYRRLERPRRVTGDL